MSTQLSAGIKSIIRADNDNADSKLDKLLSGLDKLTSRMDAVEAKKDEGGVADKILSHLDAFGKRMDAMETGMKGCMDRMDSYEKARADAAKKDEDEMMMDKAKKDAEEKEKEEKIKADAAKKDEEDKMKKEEEEARKDSASLRAQIAELQARIPMELAEADRQKFVEAQSKAEKIAQAFGDSAGAPRWVNGETVPQYRRRLLSQFKSHSANWKDADITTFDGKALDIAETQIYADAWNAAINPSTVDGMLREVKEADRTGRQISKFYGDPGAAWEAFKLPARRITGWNTSKAN